MEPHYYVELVIGVRLALTDLFAQGAPRSECPNHGPREGLFCPDCGVRLVLGYEQIPTETILNASKNMGFTPEDLFRALQYERRHTCGLGLFRATFNDLGFVLGESAARTERSNRGFPCSGIRLIQVADIADRVRENLKKHFLIEKDLGAYVIGVSCGVL